jgi:hypothetical protein
MNELERVEQMIVDNDLDRDLLRKVMTSVRHALDGMRWKTRLILNRCYLTL